MTEAVPHYLRDLTIEGVRCFREPTRLSFEHADGSPAMWTVILGENGVGKTTALRLVASAMPLFSAPSEEMGEKSVLPLLHAPWVQAVMRDSTPGAATAYAKFSDSRESFVFALSSHAKGQLGGSSGPTFCRLPSLHAYGAHRRPASAELSADPSDLGVESLFDDDAALTNVEEWLLRLKLDALLRGNDPASPSSRELEAVTDALRRLLPDVTGVEIPPPPPDRRPGDLRGLVVFHTPDGPVPFSGLSLGYRTIAALAVDLAAHLFRAHPGSGDPLSEPAICLIDELDLHLHPRWQREVVGFLRSRFRRTQFIVTTHSPLIVQASGDDANLIVLRRDARSVVVADQDTGAATRWRVDQLLTSDLFGLTSARSVEVEQKLERRRELVRLPARTDEETAELTALHAFAADLRTAESPADDAAIRAVRELAERLGARP
jgi:predicted ATPase